MGKVFHALSDPTRREILRMLRQRDMTAGEIAKHFTLAPSTLSGHFNVLKAANLVLSERSANRIVYSLNVSALEETLAAALELFRVGESDRRSKEEEPS